MIPSQSDYDFAESQNDNQSQEENNYPDESGLSLEWVRLGTNWGLGGLKVPTLQPHRTPKIKDQPEALNTQQRGRPLTIFSNDT